jgi:hypothetical protein
VWEAWDVCETCEAWKGGGGATGAGGTACSGGGGGGGAITVCVTVVVCVDCRVTVCVWVPVCVTVWLTVSVCLLPPQADRTAATAVATDTRNGFRGFRAPYPACQRPCPLSLRGRCLGVNAAEIITMCRSNEISAPFS